MTPIWIIMLSSAAAALRAVAYGLFEWREKNRAGAVGVFVISAFCAGIVVLTLISVLTNS